MNRENETADLSENETIRNILAGSVSFDNPLISVFNQRSRHVLLRNTYDRFWKLILVYGRQLLSEKSSMVGGLT